MRKVNTKQHTKKKQTNKKINKFELLFILVMMTGSLILVLGCRCTIPVLYDLNKVFIHWLPTAIFTRGQFACIKNLASHASPVKPQPLRSVRDIRIPPKFLAMNNTLILLHQMFSLLKSVRLRPPLWEKFLITALMFWLTQARLLFGWTVSLD